MGAKLFLLFSPWELEHLYPARRREGALNNTSDMGAFSQHAPQRRKRGLRVLPVAIFPFGPTFGRTFQQLI